MRKLFLGIIFCFFYFTLHYSFGNDAERKGRCVIENDERLFGGQVVKLECFSSN